MGWWNSGTSDGGTVEYLMVEQWNRDCGTSDGETVEPLMVEHLVVEQWIMLWWNSGTSDGGTGEHLMVEERKNDGGRVEQRSWNSGTETVEQ